MNHTYAYNIIPQHDAINSETKQIQYIVDSSTPCTYTGVISIVSSRASGTFSHEARVSHPYFSVILLLQLTLKKL